MKGRKPNNFAGKTIGGFSVIERVFSDNKHDVLWLTECVHCKGQKVRLASHIRQGTGCASCAQKLVKPDKSGSSLKEYSTWRQMKRRCYLKRDPGYKHYGGRGIQVCDEWVNDFWQFYRDMGSCPKGYSIERLNVDKNYAKDNCAWIPRNQQSMNRRSCVRITLNGRTEILKTWLTELGMLKNGYGLYRNRISKGMTPTEALVSLHSVKLRIN